MREQNSRGSVPVDVDRSTVERVVTWLRLCADEIADSEEPMSVKPWLPVGFAQAALAVENKFLSTAHEGRIGGNRDK